MRKHDYEKEEQETGNTATQVATDQPIEKIYGNPQYAFEEGFASAHGVRAGTAESSGRVKYPETIDDSRPDRTPNSIEKENPGLADDTGG